MAQKKKRHSLKIVTKGPMVRQASVILDGVDISNFCQMVSLNITPAKTLKATFKVILEDVDIDLGDALIVAANKEKAA